jgi:hypothetical protein
VLLVAAAAMVGTLPGRTQALGLITDPLLADLGVDRASFVRIPQPEDAPRRIAPTGQLSYRAPLT